MFMEAENYVKLDYQLHQDTQNDYPDCSVRQLSAPLAADERERARRSNLLLCAHGWNEQQQFNFGARQEKYFVKLMHHI